MWLDLKSLKKIGPNNVATTQENVLTEESQEVITSTVTSASAENIPTQAPSNRRFSLSDFKKESSESSSTGSSIITESPVISIQEPVTKESIWKPNNIVENPITVESIVHEEPEIMLTDTDDDPKEVLLGVNEIAQETSQNNKEETLSLGFEKEVVVEAVSTEPQKIYFPEFDVTKEFGFEDDLFGWLEQEEGSSSQQTLELEKQPKITEKPMEEVVATVETPETVEEIPVLENSVVSPVDAITPTEEEVVTLDIPPLQEVLSGQQETLESNETLSPEYVESVKKSLSEPEVRKWGISRLTKTLIAASFMGVLFFGGTIGWNILSKHGKANITEATTISTTIPTVTTNTNTSTVETPVITNTWATNTGKILAESGTTNTGTIIVDTETGSSSSGTLTQTRETSSGNTFTGTTTQTGEITPPVTSSTIVTDSGLEYRVTENTKVNVRRPRNLDNSLIK